VADLTPDQYAEMLRKLDDVCHQAQELGQRLREKMTEATRADTPSLQGQPEPRRKRR